MHIYLYIKWKCQKYSPNRPLLLTINQGENQSYLPKSTCLVYGRSGTYLRDA